MGKRKRRLHSPKYANKFASVRETYRRLRGVVSEATADGVVTPVEAKEIEAAQEEVDKALAAVEAVETAPEPVEEETAPEPVEEEAPKPAPKKKSTIKRRFSGTKAKKSTSKG